MPDAPREVTHIAVVQVSGLADGQSTKSDGFSSLKDALDWVETTVKKAHGAESILLGHKSWTETGELGVRSWHIFSSDGPTHGWVIETTRHRTPEHLDQGHSGVGDGHA